MRLHDQLVGHKTGREMQAVRCGYDPVANSISKKNLM